MDKTVYLPDELGARAKDADLKLSRLLRDAVEAELQRRDTIAATLGNGAAEHELDLRDSEDRPYIGTLTGVALGDGETRRGVVVYLTDDERVIAYDLDKLSATEISDPETELPGWMDHDEWIAVAGDLGLKPKVAL